MQQNQLTPGLLATASLSANPNGSQFYQSDSRDIEQIKGNMQALQKIVGAQLNFIEVNLANSVDFISKTFYKIQGNIDTKQPLASLKWLEEAHYVMIVMTR